MNVPRRRRCGVPSASRIAAATAAAGLGLLTGTVGATAATQWWTPGPRIAAIAIASTPARRTLALTRSGVLWIVPGRNQGGRVTLGAPARAIAVSAAGRGVAALSDGTVVQVAGDRAGAILGVLAGPVTALAAGGSTTTAFAVAATSRGLFLLRTGRAAERVVQGRATTVVAPTAHGLPWWALVGGRLYGSADGSRWARARRVGPLPPGTLLLGELGDGTVLAVESSGLILASSSHGLTPSLQILPAGGFAGVPRPTGLAAVGPTSAYLATRGFAALLTPDDGYDWYRAAPSQLPSDLEAVASVGPVAAASHPSGDVIVAGPGRLYLHRLQSLPSPPVYVGGSALLQWAGIAATTAAAILLGLTGIVLAAPRRGRRRLGRLV